MENKDKFKNKIKFPDKVSKTIKKTFNEDSKNSKNIIKNNNKGKTIQTYESSVEKNNERMNIHKGRIGEKLKREIIIAMKEENNLPMIKPFSKNIPLKTMVYFYNKYWNNDLTDSDCSSSDSDSFTNTFKKNTIINDKDEVI